VGVDRARGRFVHNTSAPGVAFLERRKKLMLSDQPDPDHRPRRGHSPRRLQSRPAHRGARRHAAAGRSTRKKVGRLTGRDDAAPFEHNLDETDANHRACVNSWVATLSAKREEGMLFSGSAKACGIEPHLAQSLWQPLWSPPATRAWLALCTWRRLHPTTKQRRACRRNFRQRTSSPTSSLATDVFG
jgi:hypothetical protein